MNALVGRVAEHQLGGLAPAMAEERAIAELEEIRKRSFSPMHGKTDAVFNSGGTKNFDARETFLRENTKSFGDWQLQGGSTQWINENIQGNSRLAFFAFNSALFAQSVARDPKVNVIVPFTAGLTQAVTPKSIWANQEFPAILHEATQGANPNIVGVSGRHIVEKIGVSNIDKPEVVFPLSKALGDLVKDGKGLDTSVSIGSRELHDDPVRPGEFIVKPVSRLQESDSPLKQATARDAHEAEARVHDAHDKTGALTLKTAMALPVDASRKDATDHMLAALLANDSAVMYAGISAGLNTRVSQEALQQATHMDAHVDPVTQAQSQPAPPQQGPVKKH
ncbi:MAG TPA: hypothetical protein VF472_16500 [Burkholderiaceae bacterium]